MNSSLDTGTPDDVFETIATNRRVYNQLDLDNIYKETATRRSLRVRIRSTCEFTKAAVCKRVLSVLPILYFIRWYKWKQNLIIDIISGLSVGFMHLPVGLAMGILSSLKPIYGLYTTFFGVVFYSIFGTSRHVSFGTNAVLTILTAAIVEREASLKYGSTDISKNISNYDQTIEHEKLEYKVGIAMATSFMAGIILLVMGLFRFGFITNYLSVAFVGGFTTAAAFHMATSQVSKILGIKIGTYIGAGKMVLIYKDIFNNLEDTHLGDLAVGLVSCAILLAVKIGINERYEKKMKMPVPIDLILVITATIISHFAEFERRFGIHVVGDIPSGMPVPRLPELSALGRISKDSFIIAILAFAMSITMTKLCAALHNYEIDSSQELVAYGATNLFGSFFQCIPMCLAPPRTMLLSSLGAKTTLHAIPTAIFIFVILMAAGPLFVSLPVPVLAAMIIVAVKNVLLQVRQLPHIWKVSKWDFVIWLITLNVGILVDLDIGIIVGVGISIFTVIVQSQFASGYLLGISEQEDIYLDLKGHKRVKEVKGIKIFYFSAMLFFASAERFKSQLFEKTFNPLTAAANQIVEVDESVEKISNNMNKSEKGIHHIIIDCSTMTYIDMAGVNVLRMIVKQYKRAGTDIFLANCRSYMLKTLDNANIYDVLPKDHIFYDVHDAVNKASGYRLFVVKL